MMIPLAQLTSGDDGLQAPISTAADLPFSPEAEWGPGPAGLYIHVPFCIHKCHYCDFYSLVETGPESRRPAFTDRLIQEIRAAGPWLGGPLETIFVGGGTPTLLEPVLWSRLLAAIDGELNLHPDCEFTVEANPDTLSAELLEVLAAGGVNRLSMGAQSFDPAMLKALERTHDPANVRRGIELARSAGITNVNLDLMFGIPGQLPDGWAADLDAVLALEPEHLSCYNLTYEPNTPLAEKLRRGAIERVDQDIEAEMYEATIDRLAGAGFEHYEISNWARPGQACRHNLLYWRNGSWWPVGPGAAGHVDGVRWKNAPRLGEYLRVGPLPPISDVEQLDQDGRIGEILMLGLRLMEGISLDRLEGLLAVGDRGAPRRLAVDRYTAAGLLEQLDGRLRFTRAGLLLADTVLADLL
jgi:oxygen-independent coproporphyrinogen-3 oxidase